MFNGIRKPAAILLALAFIFMLMPAQAEPAAADNLFGTVSGDTYENAFIGVGCLLEGWHYYSDEEIDQVNSMAKEMIAEELKEGFTKQITVMVAATPDGQKNVNIALQSVQEYASVYEQLGIKTIAESGLDSMKSALEGSGMSDVQLALCTTNIGGEEFTGFDGQYILSGIQMYMRQIWLYKDGYLTTITFTARESGLADEVFSHFYRLP